MQNFYEHRACEIGNANEKRKRRFADRGRLAPVDEEGVLGAPPRRVEVKKPAELVFKPPSPAVLPPEPHPLRHGTPVRVLSPEALELLPVDLRLCLLREGKIGRGRNTVNDVVLTVMEGGGGLKNNAAEGELARHGHWYFYEPNDVGARKPRKRQNIKAMYISGDATAVNFDSLAACLLTKPPKVEDAPATDRFGRKIVHIEGEAWSALDVMKNGPGYGPYTLLLHDAVIEGKILEALAEMLLSNPLVDGMCTLDTLIFINNSLKSVKKESVTILLDSFKKNYRLAVIRFSFNQIQDPLANQIFSRVTGCGALQTLNLSDNLIGDAGTEACVKMLAETPQLTALILENNRISDKGMLHICRGLVRNTRLKELNLNGNRLRDISMYYLAAVLVEQDKDAQIEALQVDPNFYHNLSSWAPNQSLQTLRVSRNYLADAAAESVARMFWEHPTVTTFDLSNNHIGESGAIALANGVMQITGMGMTDRGSLNVALSRNRFGHSGSKAIKQAVQSTGNVHAFKMEGVRPGFGIVEDAAGPVLEEEEPVFDFLDISLLFGSRPSTTRFKKRVTTSFSRLPTNESSWHRSDMRTPRSSIRTSRSIPDSANSSEPEIAKRNLRILETPPPLYDTLHSSGSQTDRATESEKILPDIARPRTVRFLDERAHEIRGAPTKSASSVKRSGSGGVLPEIVRLKTAERAASRDSRRASIKSPSAAAKVRLLASPDVQEGRYTGALSGRIENEPSFVAACDRIGMPADIIKPPKTGGTRKTQRKIYERYVKYHSKILPKISSRLPQMMRIAELAGVDMYKKVDTPRIVSHA